MPIVKKQVIGLCKCPECGFNDAEVKEDKNGFAYRWCPDCYAQYFSREIEKDQRLRASMRPAAKEPEAQQGAATAGESAAGGNHGGSAAPAAPPAPKPRAGFSLDQLGGKS